MINSPFQTTLTYAFYFHKKAPQSWLKSKVWGCIYQLRLHSDKMCLNSNEMGGSFFYYLKALFNEDIGIIKSTYLY